MIVSLQIESLNNYVSYVKEHISQWGENSLAWFRGEPDVEKPLLPKVYRKKDDGTFHNENSLLQMFRIKAPNFVSGNTPPRGNTDQWLFLAQHVGLPTRLLDWTESALLGLYFALKCKDPVVWMINPHLLNRESITTSRVRDYKYEDVFPLTWFVPKDGSKNIGVENIKGAWERNYDGIQLPVAVIPTYTHPRMSAQRSVFTIHGARKEPLSELVPEYILRKFIINPAKVTEILNDLHLLGIHHSTAFPDLDGLAAELSDLY